MQTYVELKVDEIKLLAALAKANDALELGKRLEKLAVEAKECVGNATWVGFGITHARDE